MNTKYEVIKKVDLDKDITVFITKRIEEPQKKCKGCEHFKYFGDLSLHYCSKYKGVVEENDICIEVGL